MGVPAWLIVLATGFVIASIDEYHQALYPRARLQYLGLGRRHGGYRDRDLIGMRRYRAIAGRPEKA